MSVIPENISASEGTRAPSFIKVLQSISVISEAVFFEVIMAVGIPFYHVFYKVSNTPGWKIAFLTGTHDEILNIIKEFKWVKYEIHYGGEYSIPVSDRIPAKLEPDDIHLRTMWIYSKEYKKWFFPDEIIPFPKSKPKQFFFNFEVNWEDYLNNDLAECYDEEPVCFCSWATVKINNYSFVWEYCDCYYEVIKNSFEELKKHKYTFISIDELTYVKFLIWDFGETIRFKVQDYCYSDRVREPIDIQIEKQEFYKTFINLLNTLERKNNEFKKTFNRAIDSIGKISYSSFMK